jgi:hypothetical protein
MQSLMERNIDTETSRKDPLPSHLDRLSLRTSEHRDEVLKKVKDVHITLAYTMLTSLVTRHQPSNVRKNEAAASVVWIGT